MVKSIAELTPEQRARIEDPANRALISKRASHLIKKYHDVVELEDLLQTGFLGLVDAVVKYDSSKGKRFKAYARTRIWGEMIDLVRDSGWRSEVGDNIAKEAERILEEDQKQEKGPVQHMTRYAAYKQAAQKVLGEGRKRKRPFYNENNFRQITILRAMQDKELCSLEAALIDDQAPQPSAGLWQETLTPPEIIEHDQQEPMTREVLTQAIEKLPEPHRDVIKKSIGGKTLRQIGDEYGVTESNICHWRTKAMKALRREVVLRLFLAGIDGDSLGHSR